MIFMKFIKVFFTYNNGTCHNRRMELMAIEKPMSKEEVKQVLYEQKYREKEGYIEDDIVIVPIVVPRLPFVC